MATLRQIEANRRNALKSTGPRTEAGKEVARMNGAVHGLRSHNPLPVQGASAVRSAILERFQGELKPQGALEELAVRRIAQMEWRLRCLDAASERIASRAGEPIAGPEAEAQAMEAAIIAEGLLSQGPQSEALFRISDEQMRLQRGICRMHDRLRIAKAGREQAE